MYKYNRYDQQLIDERVAQFRDQTKRYLKGLIPEEEFLDLRLRNGLYIQRHAPMLRVAIPYGMLNSKQLRKLAYISRHYDKAYGHFTTRQNIQFNWPELEKVPDILADLAEVQMHAIQTSGNVIRNTSTDEFAGVAADEIEDSRPWCELIRQWSTFHPEFNWLPRKFKIAVTGAAVDRAAIQIHDIGLRLIRKEDGEVGFEVLAGGGLGRTPIIGSVIKTFLPGKHLLTYLDAMLRIYNRFGRRDNKFKARIKILVRAMTAEKYAEKVEQEWQALKDGPGTLTEAEINRVSACFTHPEYETFSAEKSTTAYSAQSATDARIADDSGFAAWQRRNVKPHKVPGYAIVILSLKPTGVPPGDVTDTQMLQIADLADKYSFGEVRTTHEQNLVLADVKQRDLYALWQEATSGSLATPNAGLLTDMICCPGGDFCSLANAKSIPVAEAIQRRYDSIDTLHDLGEISINISGCMNACGHHHVGNIGILGVDKKGEEWYQISIGGSAANDASLASIIGPSFAREEVPDVIDKIISVYTQHREAGESFLATYRRIGMEAFKTTVYAKSEIL
ncbi:MAG: nitrite/sulfite reductase [Gammaproteobacteria bacterium]|nr:nitrite/sulfite reductase [Gammaproteobacteria bacterium]